MLNHPTEACKDLSGDILISIFKHFLPWVKGAFFIAPNYHYGGVTVSEIRNAKEQVVQEITDKLKNSMSVVVVDYRGLKVSEVTELRKQLRDNGVEFKVYKNTLTRRAVENAGLTELNEFLTGPNAIAFCESDVIAPAKVLHTFSKDHEALEIKAGVLEGVYAPVEDVKAIATLPSKDGLVSMLLSVLQAPVRNFAYAVKAIGEEKENTEG